MPEVEIGKKKIKFPYTEKGKKLAKKFAIKFKKKKKKKKQLKYGQIPTGSAPENPVGGN